MIPAKTLVAVALGTLWLSGCATSTSPSSMPADAEWLDRASDCCAELADLPLMDLSTRGSQELEFGPMAPVHRFDTGVSAFRALRLPRSSGPLRLELVSAVQRDVRGQPALFAPTLLILDEAGRIRRRHDWQEFTYRPAQGLKGDRLTLSLDVMPSSDADRLVVLTTEAALSAETELLHPARALARARHLAEPAVLNPLAVHRARGEVTLRVHPIGETAGLLAPLMAGGGDEPAPVSPPADAGMAKTADTVPHGQPTPAPLDWRRTIRAALAAGDLDLAMSLAERAELAGETGTRRWLAQQLERR
ncbi:MalM family protein [Halomonas sp. THAF12]|uniref:MalM family protein n=1 Tax=Halomonas sp. B23F22_10 TaxID=3459515 RepID=UPI00373EAB11